MSEPLYPQHEGLDSRYAPTAYEERASAPQSRRESSGLDEQVNVFDLLIVLAKHKFLIVGFPLLVAVIVALYSLSLPNVYTATAKILPPQQSGSGAAMALLSQMGGAAGALGAPKSTNDVYVAMLKSRTVADNLIQRLNLMALYGAKYPTRARERLAGAVNIVAGRDGIIVIDVVDTDPKRAAQFANAYVDELMKLTQVLAVTEASQRRLFFERQFLQAKENLAKAELIARRALGKGGLVKVDEQGRAMLETTARLRGQITVKEVQIGAMRSFANDDNPELLMAQRELTVMKRQLARIEGDGGDATELPAKSANLGMDSMRLLRDVKYSEVVFELLGRQFEIAKIDEAKESSVIQVLDHAVEPDVKSGPKRLFMVQLALLIALVLGLIIAFVREALQRARSNPDQRERIDTFKRHLSWRRR